MWGCEVVDNVEGCNRVVSVLSEIVETTKVGSEAREQVITGSAWGGGVVRLHLPNACRQQITREESIAVTSKFPFVSPTGACAPRGNFFGRMSF